MSAIRDQFAAMASRCRDQVHMALDTFWTGSEETLAKVRLSEAAIDQAEKCIDELLLRVLALRHPVASDLRAVVASFKLVTDLERIGDEAMNITRGRAPTSPDAKYARSLLQRMTDASAQMLGSAVESFLQQDAQLAERVLRSNGTIGVLYQEVICDSSAFISRNATEVAAAMACMEVAKCLRRISEHAKNIAEGTLFLVRGDEPMPR